MTRDPHSDPKRPTLSRRTFLAGAGGVAASGALGAHLEAAGAEGAQPEPAILRGTVEITLTVNGRARTLQVEPRTTLLSALRDRLELCGTKSVCERGNCGACTVLLDGEPANACLTLAVSAVGRAVTTVEGLGDEGGLSVVQEELCTHDGLMCGFCTPGFAMSLTAVLARDPEASLDRIREGCAGNLCRCGTYPHVFQAGLEAARRLRGGR
ncbi:MAG: (2Fe-2S)-binding protein [Planctomycetota bacterium]|jgi:xanthine dehydrogenase YagT iron-sulfur-binding subunit|nr:(2Fe-2S)-binding protein [Planctomycetota bacterium]MDP6990246.1 (2Fe-2S)-binding protein [Planctomycetota bacterium]